MEHLKYPVGKFSPQADYTQVQIEEFINNLKKLPENLNEILKNITDKDYQKQYREGSWTVKQLVHHIGESHLNSYIRIKLALTEDNPTIKPYDENAWVKTEENNLLDASVSLKLIDALHQKFVCLAQTLGKNELDRTFFHPQSKRNFRISDMLCLYSWHSLHHTAHIKIALDSK